MYSKSPSRNNRSRGIKVKHILQICLLVAVCFWLIYQVKHSHEKKKEFDEKDAKLASDIRSGNEILRLGRKDISRVTETVTDDKLNGEDDEENEAEQAENRHEDDEQEIEESRTEDREEEEDTGKGGEDDEIELGEAKNGEENHEEESVDEEKEDNDDGEKEDNEESEAVLEHQDHEGNTQQEREEHYKADDASSEVAHDTSIISDTENATLKHTDGSSELVIDGKENVSQSSNQSLLQNPIEVTNSSDFRVSETMEHKDNLTVSENRSSENSTALTDSNVQVTNNLTKLESEQSNNITQAQNATSEDNHIEGSKSNLTLSLVSHANTSDLASDENQSVMNSTEPANTTVGSSSEVKNLTVAENITGATETKVDDVNLTESGTVDNLGSKSENNVSGEENEGSISDTANDNVDDFASSITQEEKEARTDPGTLPDINVGVENADDVEAE